MRQQFIFPSIASTLAITCAGAQDKAQKTHFADGESFEQIHLKTQEHAAD